MSAGPLLSVRGVGVSFGGVRALHDVSFDVAPREVFTIIGPNGAGKTTLFNLVSGIYRPDAGQIHFEGQLLTELAPHRIAALGIARTFQNIELFEHASVLQNLLIGRHIHRRTNLWQDVLFTPQAMREAKRQRERVEQVIDLLRLQHYRDARVAGLPYGVRKVVELARALCLEPRLLLLDEPSSGLNAEETTDMVFWIRDLQRDLGITVVMVEHDMSLVTRVSSRVLALNMGEAITLGSSAEVQAHPAVIEAYLGRAEEAQALRRTHPRQAEPAEDSRVHP